MGKLRVSVCAGLCLLAALLSTGGCQCLVNLRGDLPDLEDPNTNNNDRIQTGDEVGTQAIIPDYVFDCCGNVTSWGASVRQGGGRDDFMYDINFQVWRPSPTVQDTGCYSLVGQNRFTSIDLDDHTISGLVPSNTIQVSRGDVMGVYVFSREGPPRGIQLDTGISALFYYTVGSFGAGSPDCPAPVGAGQTLDMSRSDAAPKITVGVETFDCPMSSTTMVMTSSSTQPTPTSSSSFSSSSSSSMVVASETPTPDTTTDPPPTTSSQDEVIPPLLPSTSSSSPATPTPTPSEEPSTSNTMSSDPSSLTPAGGLSETVIIVIIVAFLVLVIVVIISIVIVVVFLTRRKHAVVVSKDLTINDNSGVANPSYDSAVAGPLLQKYTVTSADGSTTKSSHRQKPKTKPPPVPHTVSPTSMENPMAIYEMVDNGVGYKNIEKALDYTYPKASPTAKHNPFGENPYEYAATSDGNFYHAVGPHIGAKTEPEGAIYTDPTDPQQKPPLPPLPVKDLRLGGNVYHSLDSSASSVQYELPTVSKFRNNTGIFEAAGIYVPTEEQRAALGSHYELPADMPPTYNKLQFFEEDQTYWAPASTTSGLYQQLASKKYREIPRNQLILLEQIGAGQFGLVCKGLWKIGDAVLEVAVKTLKAGSLEEDKVKFLQEAAIMGQFLHPNVVKLHGVVTVGEPAIIILEIMANGDLRSYLRSIDLSRVTDETSNELQNQFLRFAREIASGMDYLSTKAFVHRDLAARNILLNEMLTCKIGDFGMARDLMEETYYHSRGGKIPVKWTAPEALLYKKYSTDSDVWSYGMVLFEVWSVGCKPFQNRTNNEVLSLVNTGHCQPPPPGCPHDIYKLMVNCWNPTHQDRPKFDEVVRYLQDTPSQLLYWSVHDDSISPGVNKLGGDLNDARALHLELQNTYKT